MSYFTISISDRAGMGKCSKFQRIDMYDNPKPRAKSVQQYHKKKLHTQSQPRAVEKVVDDKYSGSAATTTMYLLSLSIISRGQKN